MSDHFRYLLEDHSSDFFTKAAEEHVAAVLLAPAPSLEKAASVHEALTRRLDRDLVIIRDAGPIGLELGMCKRASAYLEDLSLDSSVPDEAFLDVCEKLAAAAIEADIEAASARLHEELPPALHAKADQMVAKVAMRLIKAANPLELLEGGKALSEVAKPAENLAEAGKALRPPPGPGIGKRIAEGFKKVPEKLRYARAAVPAAFTHGIPGAYHEMQAGRKGLKAIELDKQVGGAMGKSKAAVGDAGKAYHDQVASNLAKQREGHLSSGAMHEEKLKNLGGEGRSRPGSPGEAGRARIREGQKSLEESTKASKNEAAEAAKAPENASAATPAASKPAKGAAPGTREHAEQQFKANQEKAKSGAAAEPPKTETKPEGGEGKAEGKSEKTEGGEGSAANDEKPAGAIHETMTKFMRGEKLSPAERRQMFMGGAAAVGGHRVLSGRDLLTGDKND